MAQDTYTFADKVGRLFRLYKRDLLTSKEFADNIQRELHEQLELVWDKDQEKLVNKYDQRFNNEQEKR